MAENREIHLPRIEGEIVRDSPLKTLGLCLMAIFLLAPLGVGLVWAWWTGFSFLDRQVSWYGAVIGAVLVLGGILAVPVAVLCFFRRNQLILGEQYLQLVRGENVTIQIPYRNVAQIELDEAEVKGKYIGIDLFDLNESGTLCPGAEITKKGFGWHYTLTDESWTVPLNEIHERIRNRLPSHPSNRAEMERRKGDIVD